MDLGGRHRSLRTELTYLGTIVYGAKVPCPHANLDELVMDMVSAQRRRS